MYFNFKFFFFNILGEIQHGIAEEGPTKETYLA